MLADDGGGAEEDARRLASMSATASPTRPARSISAKPRRARSTARRRRRRRRICATRGFRSRPCPSRCRRRKPRTEPALVEAGDQPPAHVGLIVAIGRILRQELLLLVDAQQHGEPGHRVDDRVPEGGVEQQEARLGHDIARIHGMADEPVDAAAPHAAAGGDDAEAAPQEGLGGEAEEQARTSSARPRPRPESGSPPMRQDQQRRAGADDRHRPGIERWSPSARAGGPARGRRSASPRPGSACCRAGPTTLGRTRDANQTNRQQEEDPLAQIEARASPESAFGGGAAAGARS